LEFPSCQPNNPDAAQKYQTPSDVMLEFPKEFRQSSETSTLARLFGLGPASTLVNQIRKVR
jgi:hypothetical protein